MSTAEERRRRLGPAAVDAARRSARDAPTPGRALRDALATLLTGRGRLITPPTDADATPRDAA